MIKKIFNNDNELKDGNTLNKTSLYVLFILCIAIICGRFQYPRWNVHNVLAILSWDVMGYYLYLPLTFIYHDLGLKDASFIDTLSDFYFPSESFYQAALHPNGNYVMQYPIGLSILYSPFFFMGHIYAKVGGFPPDGFSAPYQFFIAMGGLFYSIIGLYFLRKLLLRFFTDKLSAAILILIVLGTNYFDNSAYNGLMAHNFLFTLFVVIFNLTISWHEKPQVSTAVCLGLLIGLSVIVRPSAIVIILLPLLWGAGTWSSLKEKFGLVWKYKMHLLFLSGSILLAVSPQLLYWKKYTGNFIFYSYTKAVGFDFLHPFLSEVLFSYKKGWLLYTPIMAFSIIGFIFLFIKNRTAFAAIFIFFLINLWVISSWEVWWYGGNFGQRSFVESYSLMAIPLGYFLSSCNKIKMKLLRIPIYLLFVFLIFLNLFQTWQYMNWIISPDRMTKEYYWAVFLKTKVPQADKRLLEEQQILNAEERITDPYNFTSVYNTTIDFESNGNYSDKAVSGSKTFRISPQIPFSPGFESKVKELVKAENSWIRVSVQQFHLGDIVKNNAGLVVSYERGGETVKYRKVKLDLSNARSYEWNMVSFEYSMPLNIKDNDIIKIYVWMEGQEEVLIDDLKIEVLQHK